MVRFAVVLGVVGCAVLVSEALAATHKTGQYVVVLGEDGGGIAGSYWLAPDVKLSVRPHAQYGEISFFADRDFFPARVTESTLLLLERYVYRPTRRRPLPRAARPSTSIAPPSVRSSIRAVPMVWSSARSRSERTILPSSRWDDRQARRARPGGPEIFDHRRGPAGSRERSARTRLFRGIRHRPRRTGGGTGANRR
jgi:hypothetical protein